MSLLMDALRKAEQQKQQGTTPESAPETPRLDSLSLAPLPTETAASPSAAENAMAQGGNHRELPELPKRLEELDDQFFTSDPRLKKSLHAPAAETKARETSKAPPAKRGGDIAPREAAQNVFAAKQPAATVGPGFAISVGVGTMIAVIGIGGYFYWQMQPKGGLNASTAPTAAQAPLARPQAVPAVTPSPVASPPVQASTPANLPAVIALTDEKTPRPVGKPPVIAGESMTSNPTTSRTERPSTVVARAPVELAGHPDNSIRLSASSRKSDTTMERAHDAFNRGEVDQARSIWQKALQSDSRNTSALLGLATLAQNEGKQEQAAAYYRRVLEVDPKEAVAYSGLLSLYTPTDTRQTESQLKSLLAEQPASPHLNFSLGNLYGGDGRWAEAQQAYFKAHVADPANPDYLYNLAVSLDHLHQTNVAAQYYARALVAARSQAAAFDPAQAEERMKALQPGRAR